MKRTLSNLLVSAIILVAASACAPSRTFVDPVRMKPDQLAIDDARLGNCERATPVLRCFAYQGRGNEMARASLGSCLVKTSAPGNPQWAEGLIWLRRAADTGLNEAQRDLIEALPLSPSPADIVEAQTWRLIYERGKSLPFPPPPLSSASIQRLEERLTPELRAEASARAQAWSYRFWSTPPGDPQAQAALATCPKPRERRNRKEKGEQFDRQSGTGS